MSSDSFVHLHVHTEYSMLDGAAKVGPLFEEVTRQGMSAVAITDHGNLFGVYEFYRAALAAGVKPILGIEAYLAPASRFHKKPVFWGDTGQREVDEHGRGGDVSKGGAYTHMTLWAESAEGLRNLMVLSTRADKEGKYHKPRMDRELLGEHAAGILASTGCPSGEVQTRLRLGQSAEALQAAADYRDIFGPGNFYLELMDHGLPIERSVRAGLLEIGAKLGLDPLPTNDSHYVTQDQAGPHEALLCVQTGKTLSDPDRFKLDGDGYYIKSPAEMRAYWDRELPGAADNTVMVAERIGDYGPVFENVNRMPRFRLPGEGPLESEVYGQLGAQKIDPAAGIDQLVLIVRLEAPEATAASVKAVKQCLVKHQGTLAVLLVVAEDDREIPTMVTKYPVAMSAGLLHDLAAIPGAAPAA